MIIVLLHYEWNIQLIILFNIHIVNYILSRY